MRLEHKIVMWISIFVFIVIFATIGYMALLDISFLDALYMTVITISTVGYTEVAEMTTEAKIFSIIVIALSVSTVGFIFSRVISLFSGGFVNQVWRKNKMERNIDEMKKHYIICGAGETGWHIIKQFQRQEVSFVVIDQDEQVIQELTENNINYILGDATQDEVLLKAGIERASGLVAALSKDADNVFTVLTAKQLNEKIHVVARAIDKSSHKKLKRAGANHTVSPNEIGGRKMATVLLKPSLTYFMDHVIETEDMTLDLEEIIVNTNSELAGKKLQDCKIPEKTGLIVLAIRRQSDGKFEFNPKMDAILQKKDHLIVIGEYEQIENLKKMARDNI